MPLLPAIIAFLKTSAGRLAGAGVAVSVALFLVYSWGRAGCAAEYARKAAKQNAVWSEKIRAAESRAYAKGLEAAKASADRQKAAEDIARDAGMELGADDVCLSEDIVDSIRALQ